MFSGGDQKTHERLVIELRFRDDWSLTKVAAALGVTVGSVKAMQRRAVLALEQRLRGVAPGRTLAPLEAPVRLDVPPSRLRPKLRPSLADE
jgi:hypothetical protein